MYVTHDNYSRTFIVVDGIDKSIRKINIYRNKCFDDYDNTRIDESELIGTVSNYKEIFIGGCTFNMRFGYGNSVFLRIDNETKIDIPKSEDCVKLEENKYNYLYICERIINFAIDDKVLCYVGSIGNNDVLYPYTVGVKKTYLILENTLYNNIDLPDDLKDEDIYRYYYGIDGFEPHDKRETLEVRTLYSRFCRWGKK